MIKLILAIVLATSLGLISALPSSSSSESSGRAQTPPLKSNETCLICEFVLKLMSQFALDNATEPEVEKLLEFVCEKGFPEPLKDECSNFVKEFGPVVISLLVQNVNPDKICKLIGVCPKTEQDSFEEKIQDKPVCELCTIVLGAAKTLLDSNKTDDEVLAFIEKNLCGKLGSLNGTCVQYVETYGKVILYELSQKIDPSIVCNHLGLCATIKNLRPDPTLKPMTDAETLNCTLCKLVFQQVDNLLQQNATEQEILEFIINNVCKATGPLAPTCKALVVQYGPALIEEVAKQVDPEKLCELIQFCSNKTHIQEALFQVAGKRVEKPKKSVSVNPVYCSICEYAVQFLDVELKKNNTEAAIDKALEDVCKLAPKSSRTQCESIVNTYGIYLVELLLQFADPTKVCQAIKLC